MPCLPRTGPGRPLVITTEQQIADHQRNAFELGYGYGYGHGDSQA